ncbi:MAG: hypothetical protein ACLQAH_00975 [Limisphaerales bacterium]
MNERELLVDCLRRLNRLNLTYYLTGSMARNYWGIPRTTHDLDFVLQLPPAAVAKIVSAFSPDYFMDEASVHAAYQPPHQFNAIDTRSALKVDFSLPKPSSYDKEMLRRRLEVKLFGEPAWIATAEDVILHKLVWNRITPSERQLGDAAGVVAVQRATLDEGYLKKWAADLGLAGDLARLLSGKIRPKQT